jgi:hypothetical protein
MASTIGASRSLWSAWLAVILWQITLPGSGNLLRDGVDAISQVPRQRWDVDAFFDPEPATSGRCTLGGVASSTMSTCSTLVFRDFRPGSATHGSAAAAVAGGHLGGVGGRGDPPDRLQNSATGVFVGISNSDYRLLYQNLSEIDAYVATGTCLCIAANRLSYTLNLRGPSMAIDTACSSSLVAVHLACQSLKWASRSWRLRRG